MNKNITVKSEHENVSFFAVSFRKNSHFLNLLEFFFFFFFHSGSKYA